MNLAENAVLIEGDISPNLDWAARDSRLVAWDIETSGLDWKNDRIATCQVYVPNHGIEIIRIGEQIPDRLRELLMSERVVKVFHHAAFDLRFMTHHWNALPKSVACTKILSKIVRPDLEPKQHSLKPTLWRYLEVEIDKGQQTSDWFSPELGAEQLAYAARDVEFLVPLFEKLLDVARAHGLADIAERTFAYLPTRVETDLRGCGDVFSY